MRLLVLFACSLFVPTALAAPSDHFRGALPILAAPTDALEFARHLEREGDLYRAIGEYKRVDFHAVEPALRRAARLGIARCYHAGRRWPAVEAATTRALELEGWDTRERTELTAARALALWNLGRAAEANDLLSKLSLESLEGAEKLLRAWVAMAAGDIPGARTTFAAAGHEVAVTALKGWPPERKNPTLAGILSGVIPGAGQLYTGKPKAAFGAFIVNGLLLGSTIESFDQDHDTLGWGLGLLTLAFWSGNVYGAVNFAHTSNRESFQERDTWLARRLYMNQDFRHTFKWSFTQPF